MRKEAPVRTKPADHPTTAMADRLAKLQDQLDLIRGQVRQAQQLAVLGTSAATFAHEVNNLLTPILAYADAAQRADDETLRKKALSVTIDHVQMIVAMSERILEISAAKAPLRTSAFVRQVAEDAVKSLCRDLDKDGITLTNEIDDDLTVWADPLQLRQVLFNLLLNAREALTCRRGGRITFTGRSEGDQVVITVQDTGAGIPPEHLGRIFDPLHSSKSAGANGKVRCAGLGLALCRDLIEENDGSISATSEAGVSTTFTITLPAGKTSHAVVAEIAAPAQTA